MSAAKLLTKDEARRIAANIARLLNQTGNVGSLTDNARPIGCTNRAMRLVAEYRKRAEECRELATRATSPADKSILENMARSWEMLAQLRKNDLELDSDAA